MQILASFLYFKIQPIIGGLEQVFLVFFSRVLIFDLK